MIDICDLVGQFEAIYGDIDFVIKSFEKNLRYGEKLKKIAKKQGDIEMAEATIQTNSLIIATLKGEKSINEFKKEIWEIEKRYPEVFKRGRRDIGTSEDAVKAIIHRIEYMINRYDVRYPSYDMHRCNDSD